MTVVVREFSANEWRTYRELRLGALRESPDAFGSTLAHESARTDEDWVTCGDSPALRLYQRAGFVAIGDPQPLRPGSALRSQGMQLILPSPR